MLLFFISTRFVGQAPPAPRKQRRTRMSAVKLPLQLKKIVDEAAGPEFCRDNALVTARVVEAEMRARRQLNAYVEAVCVRMEGWDATGGVFIDAK